MGRCISISGMTDIDMADIEDDDLIDECADATGMVMLPVRTAAPTDETAAKEDGSDEK